MKSSVSSGMVRMSHNGFYSKVDSKSSSTNDSIMFMCSFSSLKSLAYLLNENTFSSIVIFPNVNLIILFLQLTIAFDVARNNLPKITGI